MMKLPIASFGVHTNAYFEGISQALFFKNIYFGGSLLILLSLFSPQAFICGVFASLVAYLHSIQIRTPKILKQTGLLTLNGLFFGVAFAELFRASPQFYFCLIVGSFIIPILTKASFEVLQHWKLSPLIAPYILTTWIFILCEKGLNLTLIVRSRPTNPSLLNDLTSTFPLILKLTESLFLSIGQIFLIQNSLFGFLLLLLVLCFDPRRGFFFLLGTALSTLIFYSTSNGQFSWQYSFFSCSAALVSLGLASMLEKFSWRTIILFSIFSLLLTLATDQLLIQFSLPILSLPYVLTLLMAQLSRTPRLNVSWVSTKASRE